MLGYNVWIYDIPEKNVLIWVYAIFYAIKWPANFLVACTSFIIKTKWKIKIKVRKTVNGGNKVEKISTIRYAQFDLILVNHVAKNAFVYESNSLMSKKLNCILLKCHLYKIDCVIFFENCLESPQLFENRTPTRKFLHKYISVHICI